MRCLHISTHSSNRRPCLSDKALFPQSQETGDYGDYLEALHHVPLSSQQRRTKHQAAPTLCRSLLSLAKLRAYGKKRLVLEGVGGPVVGVHLFSNHGDMHITSCAKLPSKHSTIYQAFRIFQARRGTSPVISHKNMSVGHPKGTSKPHECPGTKKVRSSLTPFGTSTGPYQTRSEDHPPGTPVLR